MQSRPRLVFYHDVFGITPEAAGRALIIQRVLGQRSLEFHHDVRRERMLDGLPKVQHALVVVQDHALAARGWSAAFLNHYTKIEFIERDLGVSRLTATKYLDALSRAGFVDKVKVGRSNYYINIALNTILTRP